MTRNPLIFFFLLFALTACSAADAQPTHAAFTLTPSPSASPTATRTVSAPGVTPTLIAREITEVALWGKGSANVIAHSPDGTHYAVGGSQGVHIFTIDDQEEAYLLDQDYVVRLLYSPNGRYLGAETFGGAKVVDLADNETVLDVDGYAIQSMSFSYINKLLAYFTGCYAGACLNTISVHSLSSGDLLQTIPFPEDIRTNAYSQIAFSTTEDNIAAAGNDGMIYIWDARSGDLRAEIRAHAGEVGILCFSPAGSGILASYGADNILRIWDADSGTNIRTLTGFEKRVSNLDFSEDGSLLYIIENRELLLIYDMEGGKITGVQEYVDPDALLQRELRAKRGYLEFVDGMAFSPDGRILATGSYYSKPTLFWDVKTGEIVSTMDVRAVQIEYSHDGSLLATRDLDGGVSIWRTGDGVKIFATNVGSAEDILFSPDGRYLAVGSYGQILLLDVARQEIIRRINAQGERVNHLSFARDDGVLAAVVEPDVIVKYWDVSTGAVLWEFTPPDIDYSSRAVDLDNDVLSLFRAADVENNIVELWNTRTKTRIQQFTDIDDYLNILIGFNSDQTIAVVSFRYGIAFFDVATGIPLQRLDLRLGYSSLAFSPDSSLLAIGDFTGGIRLWDVRGLTGNA